MSVIRELLTALFWRGTDELLREQLRQELQDVGSWEWSVLLDMVVAHPEFDGPRLLAADWLAEEGEHERAEFILLQCRWAYLRDIFGGEMDLEPESMVLSANLEELLQPLREGLAGDWMPPALAEIALLADGEVRVRGAGITLSYRRGFLDHIALPTPRFLEQAEMLCRSHPVSVIQLSDKTPVQVNGGSWWWADSCLDPTEPACLARYVPPVLYHHLVNRTGRDGLPRQGVNPADLTFASREGAWRALSRACVGYGRSLISREGE